MIADLPPAFDRLDNETSSALEHYCKQSDITIQYVPPHNHRANKAERAIRTFKNHFIAMLCTTHKDFPLQAWDLLLPQAEVTLNLLRTSHMDTSISAWELVHGKFSFDATPIAPVGTRIVAFEGPDQRKSWAPHGVEGFYVGPAMKHYRCYKVIVTETAQTRIVDTLSWHPSPPIQPQTVNDMALDALTLLQEAQKIQMNAPNNTIMQQSVIPDLQTALTRLQALQQELTAARETQTLSSSEQRV